MFGTHNYLLFLLSGILLNITPGQDTFYIIGTSLSQGRKAGVLSVLGISSGSVIHTLAAAFGLSAILAESAVAFTVLKFVGAGYLVYLGIRLWLDNSTPVQTSTNVESTNSWYAYRAGLFTNLLNPKVALFFLAFLPQFVDPTAQSKVTAFLFLGASFITTGTIWCLFLALSAATVGSRLRTNLGLAHIVRRCAGALFVGLGIKLAVNK